MHGMHTKCHAVPSLAIPQTVAAVGAGAVQKRFSALTVFGVDVTFLNVTIFGVPIESDPVNVQTRNDFVDASDAAFPKYRPRPSRFPDSTWRTTLAIRSAAGRVNATRSVFAGFPSGFCAMYQKGGVPK